MPSVSFTSSSNIRQGTASCSCNHSSVIPAVLRAVPGSGCRDRSGIADAAALRQARARLPRSDSASRTRPLVDPSRSIQHQVNGDAFVPIRPISTPVPLRHHRLKSSDTSRSRCQGEAFWRTLRRAQARRRVRRLRRRVRGARRSSVRRSTANLVVRTWVRTWRDWRRRASQPRTSGFLRLSAGSSATGWCEPRVRRGATPGSHPSQPKKPRIPWLSANPVRTSVRRVRRSGSHPQRLKSPGFSAAFRL
jgi:hypothetical protein